MRLEKLLLGEEGAEELNFMWCLVGGRKKKQKTVLNAPRL